MFCAAFDYPDFINFGFCTGDDLKAEIAQLYTFTHFRDAAMGHDDVSR